MNLPKHIRTRRPGFTLVELLVVIAIIAVLVGLLSAAVIRALSTGSQTGNMTDLRQLAAAVQAFQERFKVAHIPSRIRLYKYGAHYDPNNQLDRDSLAFLNQVWPRLQWSVPGSQPVIYNRIDWNGVTGPTATQAGGNPTETNPQKNINNTFILDGGQCLVFFLGGIPLPAGSQTVGTQGFSTNPLNPAFASSERISPFYEFKSNRLRLSGSFYHYLDYHGNVNDPNSKAIAYFSSYGRRNGYNRYYSQPGDSSDCHNPTLYATGETPYRGTWPLAEASGRYLNPDSFQIISAGANQVFGPGTTPVSPQYWTLRNPGPLYVGGAQAGSDDQSNFHSLLLGVPAE